MKFAREKLETNDRVDDDDENDEKRDVKQRHHGAKNWVEDDLQRGNARYETKWTKNSKGTQSFHIETAKEVLEDCGN